tara:strand:+ start:595 stop:822 length:228 start_codon:yes stop_codon:yes gene_type:complete
MQELKMSMKKLTPQVLKRIIFEERQKIERDNQKNSILKELKLLVLLEKLDRKNRRKSAKLREVKRILKKKILNRS